MQAATFQAWPTVKEAWSRLKGSKRTFVYMTLAVAVVSWLLTTAVAGLMPEAPVETVTLSDGSVVAAVGATSLSDWVVRLVGIAVSSLFAGAFVAFGLRRAVGLDVRFSMLAEHIRHFPTFLLLQLMALAAMSLLQAIWWPLAVTALLVGAVMFAFVGCFVVDRDANAFEALGGSWQLASRNLGPMIQLLLISLALTLLSLGLFVVAMVLSNSVAVIAVLGILNALITALVVAVMTVAVACAFRETTGIHTAGGDLPLDDAQPALSSRA